VNAIETAVRIILGLLARGDYTTIEQVTRGRRFSAKQIERAVIEYGRRLVEPPVTWWEEVTVTPVDAGDEAAFHVAAPVWTLEEGRSDLTLELRLTKSGRDVYESEVLNLHVL